MPNRSQLTLSLLLFTICAVSRGMCTYYQWRLNRKKYWHHLTWLLVKFCWQSDAILMFFDTWYHRCWCGYLDFFDVMVFHDLWLIFMVFKVFSCFFHAFKFTVVNDAIYFVKTSRLMFLPCFEVIVHWMRLFPMITNHRSNDAMFAMYRSSVDTIDDLTRYRASTARPEEWVDVVIFYYFLDAVEHTAYIAKTIAEKIQNIAYKLC